MLPVITPETKGTAWEIQLPVDVMKQVETHNGDNN